MWTFKTRLALWIAAPVIAVAVMAHAEGLGDTADTGRATASSAAPSFVADPALRAGMKAIRDATLDVQTLVTHRRMPPEVGQRYAAALTRHANFIRSDGEGRDAAAAAEIEALLSDIVKGAEAVAGRGGEVDAIDGIIAVDEALKRYSQRFSDPTWTPLR